MNLYQLPKREKQLIIKQIYEDIPLPESSIEKDWWVVQTLAIVFQMEAAPYLVFKGGTSLSKAWSLIERFSEDVDLALSYEFLGFSANSSRTQIGKLRDASFNYISNVFLPELKQAFINQGFNDVEIGLTEVETPDQDPVKILIRYPSVTEQSPYILPEVKLEIGSRAMREPYTNKEFCSLIGEKFPGRTFADSKISITTVNPERTFLEKLFLLHEEFQRPKEKIRVKGLSRHLYDIYRISKTPYAKKAMEDTILYQSIIEHREHFTKLGGVDYSSHFPPNLNPIPPDHLIDLWESDYKTMQQQMIYGEHLPFSELISEIKKITNKINSLKL